jgi:hypothetical protein
LKNLPLPFGPVSFHVGCKLVVIPVCSDSREELRELGQYFALRHWVIDIEDLVDLVEEIVEVRERLSVECRIVINLGILWSGTSLWFLIAHTGRTRELVAHAHGYLGLREAVIGVREW